MEETIEVSIKIRKKDLPAFIDKFNVTEYHFKDNKVSIDMTSLFDRAMAEAKESQSQQDSVF